jgi:hypothetical protein
MISPPNPAVAPLGIAPERGAPPALRPNLYRELRQLAHRFFRRERLEHTLEPTALVHEAWL